MSGRAEGCQARCEGSQARLRGTTERFHRIRRVSDKVEGRGGAGARGGRCKGLEECGGTGWLILGSQLNLPQKAV